ncbi:hypothetical protein ACFX1S_009337 [Malus domestica]
MQHSSRPQEFREKTHLYLLLHQASSTLGQSSSATLSSSMSAANPSFSTADSLPSSFTAAAIIANSISPCLLAHHLLHRAEEGKLRQRRPRLLDPQLLIQDQDRALQHL